MVKMQKKRNEEEEKGKRETRHNRANDTAGWVVIVIRHNITKKEEFIQDDRARAKRETGCSNNARGDLYIEGFPG